MTDREGTMQPLAKGVPRDRCPALRPDWRNAAMADLVMSVRSAKAHRRGGKLIVDIEGESANSRDKVVADGSANGDSAEVYVRVKPAEGFGTQMTGPYHCQASIDGGEAVTQVRVHARDGVKTVKVD